ncbi:MAG: hypothetical protein US71_C0001G0007 [Parcubacteria group bacterium GW2011_GWD2_38_12]|nr:MAG: hypothetical protein US06_C0001G0007 [Parcubacteria group bacterium GW2011_GWC2_36_17]KKQ42133.1 MAG: hypothetical protein US61_C0032G0007 [Parcubacteria group bacterium GW2011_GWE2_37_8]KKQ52804.1 MAG: hypothetical protein US71_C0001G0007 [Parcubacteria group bacterium GW2011_GWD2_38_12]KKQ59008.1 MAG: hypothetical protein US79_C0001G0007 [Parcubacteria group bacterium GW2011_GWC1_38_17]KKQ59258.1 MAG: hypothetical protein US78_C0007G0018 [Parcubacteria group bacterium GW2011_GWD1_38_1
MDSYYFCRCYYFASYWIDVYDTAVFGHIAVGIMRFGLLYFIDECADDYA